MQMNCCSKQPSIRHIAAIVLSVLILLSGVIYYGSFRVHALPQAFYWLPGIASLVQGFTAPELWLEANMPSFLHAFAIVLLLHAIVSGAAKNKTIARGLVLFALLGVEFFTGYFDWLDVLAIVTGLVAAEGVAVVLRLSVQTAFTEPAALIEKRSIVPFSLVALIGVSGLLAAGSYPNYGGTSECALYGDSGDCIEYKRRGVPVYMSYQSLRESVRAETPRSPDRIGRVYLYGNYVFLNEKNEGIHVLDNTDPTLPVNIAFIRIPGNTELAIRGNYLYADSYVDLVTLDLNDPRNVQLVNRQEDIFPYDAFQNIPYNVSFSGVDLNSRDGVVVSYKAVGSRR